MSAKMREEFDKWFMLKFSEMACRRECQAAMLWHASKEIIWIGWQASREALVIELPSSARMYFNGAPSEAYFDGVKCWHGGVDAARSAIEAAGLKVKP